MEKWGNAGSFRIVVKVLRNYHRTWENNSMWSFGFEVIQCDRLDSKPWPRVAHARRNMTSVTNSLSYLQKCHSRKWRRIQFARLKIRTGNMKFENAKIIFIVFDLGSNLRHWIGLRAKILQLSNYLQFCQITRFPLFELVFFALFLYWSLVL